MRKIYVKRCKLSYTERVVNVKDLAGLANGDVQKLINHKVLSGWDDVRIVPCAYTNNKLFMICFNTSDEAREAFDIVRKG